MWGVGLSRELSCHCCGGSSKSAILGPTQDGNLRLGRVETIENPSWPREYGTPGETHSRVIEFDVQILYLKYFSTGLLSTPISKV